MSVSDELLMNELEERIGHLLRIHAQQTEHLHSMAAEKKKLQTTVSQQAHRIEELEKKLSIATMYLSDEGSKERVQLLSLRDQVGSMIDVVDECVAFLEKGE